MDRWKAEMGRVREEMRRRKKIKRESLRRKKIQVREKLGKSRNTAFFQWFVAPEGRKVGSLKRRVRSHVVRWEMKSCTPLWREAHFQVKMYKAHQFRSTFRSCDVESARRCGAKHISKSKVQKKKLERQIFSFGKMILHDRCSTSYDLASLVRGGRSTLDRWSGKIAKRIVCIFEGSLAELFRFWCCQLPTSKIEEVSQNCFVFDVVKFKTWGSLA